ncbi:hypothetical protein [Parabacteroides sp. PF5-6]|uniref:hypothetical protein n=1 Tax=Parabacteroides sp. PF5-6 TaxID=1742403 RepID=UPI0024071104|nr:hypothetical protein [Parabacteroides sp. PF5-6]MDF9831211.1 hypothetical protein [Parabacteroides sp. PF5-6]
MKYSEYEKALSIPRLNKYKVACQGNKNKTLILYRYNIKLCQKFHGVLGVLEIILRNAIDEHYKTLFLDNDWLITQATNGFLHSSKNDIFRERDKLLRMNTYTHEKLVASLSFGAWTIMFSKHLYRLGGKTLLQIFPNKAHGLNQKQIYKDLDKIRVFRNRIAHHEPICFNPQRQINVDYAEEIFNLIIQYLKFLGYNSSEILYGVESPVCIFRKIRDLDQQIPTVDT